MIIPCIAVVKDFAWDMFSASFDNNRASPAHVTTKALRTAVCAPQQVNSPGRGIPSQVHVKNTGSVEIPHQP